MIHLPAEPGREAEASNLNEKKKRVYRRPLSYSGVHTLLRNTFGPASNYLCLLCGNAAQDWAYDHLDKNECSETAYGVYSTDLSHYMPLCCKCHARYDQRGYKLKLAY